MKLKIYGIIAVGLMTLFLSGQALACGGAGGKNSDRDQSSTYNQQTSPSDKDINRDKDINQNQGDNINLESTNRTVY